MDKACLQHVLTPEERKQFNEQGYLYVPDALSPDHVKKLTFLVDDIDRKKRAAGLGPHEPNFVPNYIPESDEFLNLVDWPATFPKVWGILGWNIYLYHTHLIVTPPRDMSKPLEKKRLNWHQDSGRVNVEMPGSNPRPMLSLKVAFFLSDVSEPGRGNFSIIPGSHLKNQIDYPADGVSDPPGGVPVCVKPGTAVFFDRRLWHTASPNNSPITRKVLFYGYGYRWIRTKDDMTVQNLWDRVDPVRKQILGGGLNCNGHYMPQDGDVPLRVWLREHRPEDAG